ncbi:dihydro-8-oxoguanine triphosphatase [Seminavis robusta]|uniref:Dihydro-8-oxoguanine triphosphatase n=1 Tax=Seminavis robusta TaxID=568900 RepID=A0A9N8ESY7_9STRA|nr:dihydro-8-oxoguanine triphosphatase [Seminavis robusta]|eukprot:Sro1596_g284730.1 dihydro-8-oxoguanine triphosphatase (217) ;mRNA; f:1340-1990
MQSSAEETTRTTPVLPQDAALSALYATIHDVPTSQLAHQTELALVLLMDRPNQRILFQVPNTKLGWRFHFGCRLMIPNNNNDDRSNDDTTEQDMIKTILQEHGLEATAIRQAGTMLFSFPNHHDPMRVTVLEATILDTDNNKSGGTWFSWESVPYQDMWADDILWLPWFLSANGSSNNVTFEGHFVFDGTPGPTSPLVAHNCQRTDANNAKATSNK